MNLFLILSRHIKHLDFKGISMLRMQRGAKHELVYRVLRFLSVADLSATDYGIAAECSLCVCLSVSVRVNH